MNRIPYDRNDEEDAYRERFSAKCNPVARLPNEIICFNPNNSDDVDTLLHKYGPDGVYEIAQVLMKAACDDMDLACSILHNGFL